MIICIQGKIESSRPNQYKITISHDLSICGVCNYRVKSLRMEEELNIRILFSGLD